MGVGVMVGVPVRVAVGGVPVKVGVGVSTAAANEPGPVDDGAALDSYSETVIRVARSVTPHVAAIEMDEGAERPLGFGYGAFSLAAFLSPGGPSAGPPKSPEEDASRQLQQSAATVDGLYADFPKLNKALADAGAPYVGIDLNAVPAPTGGRGGGQK